MGDRKINVPNNWFFRLFVKYEHFNLINIFAILLILFIVGAIIYDISHTKPSIVQKLDQLQETVDQIQIQVSEYNELLSYEPYDPYMDPEFYENLSKEDELIVLEMEIAKTNKKIRDELKLIELKNQQELIASVQLSTLKKE